VSYKPEAVSIYNSFSACSGLLFTICDLLGLPYAKLMAKRLRYSDLKTGTGRYLTTIPTGSTIDITGITIIYAGSRRPRRTFMPF